MTKINIEIKVDRAEAALAFSEDLGSNESQSNFVIVPRGGAGLNLDSGTVSILVSFFENGGVDFVRFFVGKVISVFEREKVNFIDIQVEDGVPVRIKSNMSEDTIIKIVQSTLKAPNDTKQ